MDSADLLSALNYGVIAASAWGIGVVGIFVWEAYRHTKEVPCEDLEAQLQGYWEQHIRKPIPRIRLKTSDMPFARRLADGSYEIAATSKEDLRHEAMHIALGHCDKDFKTALGRDLYYFFVAEPAAILASRRLR